MISTQLFHLNVKENSFRFFKDRLQLNDRQRVAFRNINDNRVEKSMEIFYTLHEKRILMISEIAKENPDMDKLEDYAQEIGKLHYELNMDNVKHFIELKNICTEEQKQKLQQIFIEMKKDRNRDRKYTGQRKYKNRRNHYKYRDNDYKHNDSIR